MLARLTEKHHKCLKWLQLAQLPSRLSYAYRLFELWHVKCPSLSVEYGQLRTYVLGVILQRCLKSQLVRCLDPTMNL